MSQQTLGNYARPSSAIVYTSGAYNQRGLPITVPTSGRITRLGGWLRGGFEPNVGATDWAFRFVVWDAAAGTVLAQSALLAAAGINKMPETIAISDMLRYEADLTEPLAVTGDQSILVGFAGDPTTVPDGVAVYVPVGPSGTHKYKTRNPWPGSMSGASSYAHYIGTYAFLTPSAVKVRRNGQWVDAEAHVRRNGVWVPAEVKVRRSGSWQEPE